MIQIFKVFVSLIQSWLINGGIDKAKGQYIAAQKWCNAFWGLKGLEIKC